MSASDFQRKVLDKLKAHTYPDYIKQTPDEIAADVAAAMTLVIEAARVDGPAAGRSKVGGVPDVPEDFEWPCEEDGETPLAFVCQIDLAEVHPHDLERRLPAAGMLWMFSIADGDRAYGYEIDGSTTSLVWNADPGELSAADPPEIEGEEIEEHGLEFGASFSISKRYDNSIEKAIRAAIKDAGGRTGPVRMLGNARFYKDENKDVFDPAKHVVLVELDGYTIAQNAFGEGGFTWFLAKGALAEGKLDTADVVFEPGT